MRSPWSLCPGALVSGRGRKRLTGSTENPSAPPQTHTNLRQKGTLRAVLAPARPVPDLSPERCGTPQQPPDMAVFAPRLYLSLQSGFLRNREADVKKMRGTHV